MRRRPDAARAIGALGLLCATIALWAVVRTVGPGGLVDGSGDSRTDEGVLDVRSVADVLDGSPHPSLEDGDIEAVGWTVEGDLIEPVEDILAAYRDADGTSLAMSGYLDLQGNLWGAVVRGGSDWVDVVVVSAAEDARETCVRVVRLHTDEQGGWDEAMG